MTDNPHIEAVAGGISTLETTTAAGTGKDTPRTIGRVLDAQRGHDAGERKRAERLASAPTRYRSLYRRAWAGKSLRAAVDCFCCECLGFSPAEIRRCTAPACPLYEVRPYQRRPGGGGVA